MSKYRLRKHDIHTKDPTKKKHCPHCHTEVNKMCTAEINNVYKRITKGKWSAYQSDINLKMKTDVCLILNQNPLRFSIFKIKSEIMRKTATVFFKLDSLTKSVCMRFHTD